MAGRLDPGVDYRMLASASNGYGGSWVMDWAMTFGERPALVLRDSQCPDGSRFAFEWFDATPGRDVVILYARDEGSEVVPSNRPCGGTMLG